MSLTSQNKPTNTIIRVTSSVPMPILPIIQDQETYYFLQNLVKYLKNLGLSLTTANLTQALGSGTFGASIKINFADADWFGFSPTNPTSLFVNGVAISGFNTYQSGIESGGGTQFNQENTFAGSVPPGLLVSGTNTLSVLMMSDMIGYCCLMARMVISIPGQSPVTVHTTKGSFKCNYYSGINGSVQPTLGSSDFSGASSNVYDSTDGITTVGLSALAGDSISQWIYGATSGDMGTTLFQTSFTLP